MSYKRIYRIWDNIKSRCYRKSAKQYCDYGGRGITMCIEWFNSFEAFHNWALSNGYNDTLTIDRINNDGDYTPENCKWSTREQQQQNTRAQKNNISGHKGLSWCKFTKTWRVRASINKKQIELGRYSTVDEAVTARKKWESESWQD